MKITNTKYWGNNEQDALHGEGTWSDLSSLQKSDLKDLRYVEIEVMFSLAADEVNMDFFKIGDALEECIRQAGFDVTGPPPNRPGSNLNMMKHEGSIRLHMNVSKYEDKEHLVDALITVSRKFPGAFNSVAPA
jgi:hypothetical protein